MRQPVEQFWMGRQLAHFPKVVHGRYDAATEQVVPQSVHNNSGCQRVRRMCQRLSQLQSPAVLRVRRLVLATNGHQETPGCYFATILVVPPNEDIFLFGVSVLQRNRSYRSGQIIIQLRHLRRQCNGPLGRFDDVICDQPIHQIDFVVGCLAIPEGRNDCLNRFCVSLPKFVQRSRFFAKHGMI